MAQWLIGAGADPRRRPGGGASGMLPSEAAELNGHSDLAAYLREQEAAAATGAGLAAGGGLAAVDRDNDAAVHSDDGEEDEEDEEVYARVRVCTYKTTG